MKVTVLFIFSIIKFSICCDDFTKVSLLPPLDGVKIFPMKLGENINIVCCHPDGANQLSWFNNLKKEIQFKNDEGIFTLKDEKDRLILRIENIDDKKFGEYTCANNKRGQKTAIIISANTLPSMPEIQKVELFFPKNKPIQIKCPLTSNQKLKSWIFTRGGKNVVVGKITSDASYELNIDRTIFTVRSNNDVRDIKMVWCQFQEVTSDEKVKTGLYEFTWILYNPIDLELVIDHYGPILESNNVRLICKFQYNHNLSIAFPYNTIIKPNFVINNDDLKNGNVVVTINKITKDLEGEYECRASMNLSSNPIKLVEESSRIKIDVITPPKIISVSSSSPSVKLNDDAFLNCTVKSKQLQKADFYFEYYLANSSSWVALSNAKTRYNVSLTINEVYILILQIKSITWDDRGKYNCVAKNSAGESYKRITLNVEKQPELQTSSSFIHMATKPVNVECSVSGYPLHLTEDIIELKVLNQSAPLAINVIDRKNSGIDGFSISYEVIFQGELTEGSSYKLECSYTNMKNNLVQRKGIELKIAQKPKIPEIQVVCSGSSGIVFNYKSFQTEDENKKVVKNVLSYSHSEDFDSLLLKPTKVVPIKEDDKNENMTYILKDLVASKNYTFKWESFNIFGLSNERTLSYNTKPLLPPQIPKSLEFSTKGNMVNVNVILEDKCPYDGSNSAIRDIAVILKPIVAEGQNNNWEWTESNFTLEADKRRIQFLIYLENPQIDYEIKVALRSPQGSSKYLTGIYRANMVLTGSLFSCFPRCFGSTLSSNVYFVFFMVLHSCFL